jgi:hypothetical protein
MQQPSSKVLLWRDGGLRRKIRLIDNNAKCRYLKKLAWKGTLRQVIYLSDCPLPSYDLILPPPLHTVYVYTSTLVQYTYSHRERVGWGGGRATVTREKVRGAIVYKAGRKHQHA